MKFFPITKQRAIHLVRENISKSALGILNWFVEEDNTLNVIINVRDVNYLYRQTITNKNEIDPEIGQHLHEKNEILGIIDLDAKYEEYVPDEVTADDYFQVKRLF